MHASDPLISRYASAEMAAIYSDTRKYTTWRRLWVALAEVQAELGLDISREQLEELRAKRESLDGCTQSAVTPVPSSRRASSYVNSTLASFDCEYARPAP